jgi:hypothetical protein
MFFMALIAITSYSFIFSIINLMTLEQSDYYKNHLFTVTFCGTVFAVLFCVVLPIAIGIKMKEGNFFTNSTSRLFPLAILHDCSMLRQFWYTDFICNRKVYILYKRL